jgi:hypothetical protein
MRFSFEGLPTAAQWLCLQDFLIDWQTILDWALRMPLSNSR